MKVYVVMKHEGDAADDTSPSWVERVFATEALALKSLEGHVAVEECELERILPGSASYDPLKTPVCRCTCDEEAYAVDEWEVED